MKYFLLIPCLILTFVWQGFAQFTVTGTFQYEDKEWNFNGWTGNDPIFPIRRADVTVFADTIVGPVSLGTGSTAQDGSFSIVGTSGGLLDVYVQLDTDTGNDAFQRIRVVNLGNTEYSAVSPTFLGHDTDNNDLDIGTITVGKILSGSEEANPFNMLDMAVYAWEYISSPLVGGNLTGSTVRIFWPDSNGTFATGFDVHLNDDDGYDDSVILHELGHVVHNMYSNSDSPGGTHFFGDSDQDPRLSFGEGYATFFMGAVMTKQIIRRALYLDMNGAAQNGGVQLQLRMEEGDPFTGDSQGAADESAVSTTLYDIIDNETALDQNNTTDDDPFDSTLLINGAPVDAAWWDVFIGPVKNATDLTMNNAWDGWFSKHGVGGMHAQLLTVFTQQHIDFFNDADEPNDSAAAPTMLAGLSPTWSSDRTIYASSSNPPSPGTGDQDWYQVNLVQGSIIDVETRYPNGSSDADTQADTFLRLQAPSGGFTETDLNGTGRNAAIRDFTVTETGPWLFRISTQHSYRVYGRYNYRIQYDFENFLPLVTNGPTASPATISTFGRSTLSVTVTDAQPISYQWTPLNGGQIVGSGANVKFAPPSGLTTEALFTIELMISDSLGASVGPFLINVTVKPTKADEIKHKKQTAL